MSKFIVLVSVLALLLVAAGAVRREYDLSKDTRDLWQEWQMDYPHLTASFSDDSERRYAAFEQNVARVKALNAEHAGRTQFMINKFAHLTEDEFAAIMLGTKVPSDFKYDSEKHSMLPRATPEEVQALPDAFDWRNQNPPVVTDVKDQGQCGSCWAFSTTGNIEGQWARAGHPLTSLSEQNLVDCDKTCLDGACDAGCNGGLMANAFTYVIKNGGIDTEASYPYEGVDGTCRFKPANVGAKIVNFTFVPHTPEDMQHYLVTYGPLSIAADATVWQFYYTGVWYFPCGTTLDHGILLVGYGTETTFYGAEMPYWIVKNSWGPDWGLDGYILIERGNDVCGLQDYPITSLTK